MEVRNKCTSHMSDEKLDDGNTAGFPKLKDCGGFELLLHCMANCRNLENIGCDISSSTLKSRPRKDLHKTYPKISISATSSKD